MTEFTDTSTATRVEKAKRTLRHLADGKDMTYFFDDGYPREKVLQNDALAALEVLEEMLAEIGTSYGYLWHVNNEPGTPNQYPPERAAHEARKILRDRMTHEQRGEAINRVRELMVHNVELSCDPLAGRPTQTQG